MAAAYPLAPVKYRAFDKNGAPLIGGQVFAYESGSTTEPKDTYPDRSMESLNTWPVILDDTGSAAIYISGDYYFRVFDAEGNLIEEGDGVADPESVAQALIDGSSGGANNLEQRVADLEDARDEHTDQINELIDDTAQLRIDLSKEVETDRDAAIEAAIEALTQTFNAAIDEALESMRIKVGDIHISTMATDPATKLGYGTWELVAKGKAIVGLSDVSTDPAWTKILGGTAGTYDVALTANQNGPHDHGIQFSVNTSGTGTIDAKSGGVTGSASTDSSGQGEPHNNVQPSMVFAIWRRTA
ncbi:phage baseplate protein [Acinetobacter haemolyticus]|uniref:phage baseplate protein n=1 Tax=Acinetobacter haemolyticus TaxID=29430 RepID=UPI003F545248